MQFVMPSQHSSEKNMAAPVQRAGRRQGWQRAGLGGLGAKRASERVAPHASRTPHTGTVAARVTSQRQRHPMAAFLRSIQAALAAASHELAAQRTGKLDAAGRIAERQCAQRLMSAAETAARAVLGQHDPQCTAAALDRVLALLAAVRVPVATGPVAPGRVVPRREIDLVCLSRAAITLIEVKNWNGSVSRARDRPMDQWEHITRERGGLVWRSPVADMRDKRVLLLRYLRTHGIVVPEDAVRIHVVFSNDRCILSSDIATMPEIVMPHEFQLFAGTLGAEAAVAAVHEQRSPSKEEASADATECRAPPRAQLTLEQFDRVAAALRRLPTWDRLRYANGTEAYGDYGQLRLPPGSRGEAAGAHFARLVQRSVRDLPGAGRNAPPSPERLVQFLRHGDHYIAQVHERTGAGTLTLRDAVELPRTPDAAVLFRDVSGSSLRAVPLDSISQLTLSAS